MGERGHRELNQVGTLVCTDIWLSWRKANEGLLPTSQTAVRQDTTMSDASDTESSTYPVGFVSSLFSTPVSPLCSQEAHRDPQITQRPPTRRRPAAAHCFSGCATSWRQGSTRLRAGTTSKLSSRIARRSTRSQTATVRARSASVTSPRTSSGARCGLTERATLRRRQRSGTRLG